MRVVPDSEVRLCEWPRHAPRNEGIERGPVRMAICLAVHRRAVIWNGAEWFCQACNKPVRFAPAPPVPVLEGRVVLPRTPDRFYAEATAMYRLSATSNRLRGRQRAPVNYWREDAPGLDFNGQRRRRGSY